MCVYNNCCTLVIFDFIGCIASLVTLNVAGFLSKCIMIMNKFMKMNGFVFADKNLTIGSCKDNTNFS